MLKAKRTLRAIDLYSGVGGWALGLRMAGIEVVSSYEQWGLANETNFKNNHHQAQTVDIRGLALSELPKNIDIVVGSPPCTQFSYSNRGGSGDIDDGLEDIIKFLTIIQHLKPNAWAMENVPRVAAILEKELKPKGRLAKFANLKIKSHVVNMEHYGLPQRRKRCIAGHFNFELLQSYIGECPKMTLGKVIKALGEPSIKDPIYGVTIPKSALYDHVVETFLNEEEERINRAGKITHPVYNAMPFPDPLDRTVRTITATCTRVSRESIVIPDAKYPEKLRRLTIREKASLQGFPVTFQFYGASYAQKQRMVGNAIPPLFSFHVAQAIMGISSAKLRSPAQGIVKFRAPSLAPKDTPPDTEGARFLAERTFRFAVPSLQLKSGVRLELKNEFSGNNVRWTTTFVFGTAKSIHWLNLRSPRASVFLADIPKVTAGKVLSELDALENFIRHADIGRMQNLWSHRGPGGTRPFMLLDRIHEVGLNILPLLVGRDKVLKPAILRTLKDEYGSKTWQLAGLVKLSKNAAFTATAILVGSSANLALAEFGTFAVSHEPSKAKTRL